MITRLVLAALCVVLFSVNAEARPRTIACVETGTAMKPSCMGNNFLAGIRSINIRMKRERSALKYNRMPIKTASTRKARSNRAYIAAQVVSHPSGCPARSFCGCGAAVRVFGHARRDLWLAANWLRFPRTSPAPGMVAARRGHVFVLERHIGGSTWLAWDPNSGGHRTRVHARSIAGFAIVNPRA